MIKIPENLGKIVIFNDSDKNGEETLLECGKCKGKLFHKQPTTELDIILVTEYLCSDCGQPICLICSNTKNLLPPSIGQFMW